MSKRTHLSRVMHAFRICMSSVSYLQLTQKESEQLHHWNKMTSQSHLQRRAALCIRPFRSDWWRGQWTFRRPRGTLRERRGSSSGRGEISGNHATAESRRPRGTSEFPAWGIPCSWLPSCKAATHRCYVSSRQYCTGLADERLRYHHWIINGQR